MDSEKFAENAEQQPQLLRADRSGASGVKKPATARSTSASLLGQVIVGSYRIDALLGRGGWGEVYRASQLALGRNVAIKFLHRQYSHDESKVRRFHLEVEAIRRLNHRSVTPIYDSGVTVDGQPFIVMEFLEGESLQDVLCRDGRLGWCQWLPLMIQICDGLNAAHENGIVHRDIKPSNILLVGQPPNRQVKIVDFGTAKLAVSESMPGEGISVSNTLTGTGELFGTPTYMSPEQCLGKPLDGRTDMYSLGCVAYEVMTGQSPFESSSAYDCMENHVSSSPRPFPAHAAVPVSVQRAVLKCLDKDQQSRFPSMHSLSIELHRLIDQDSPEFEIAVADSTGANGAAAPSKLLGGKNRTEWSNNRKIGVVAAALLSLAAVVLASWYMTEHQRNSSALVAGALPPSSRSSSVNPEGPASGDRSNDVTATSSPDVIASRPYSYDYNIFLRSNDPHVGSAKWDSNTNPTALDGEMTAALQSARFQAVFYEPDNELVNLRFQHRLSILNGTGKIVAPIATLEFGDAIAVPNGYSGTFYTPQKGSIRITNSDGKVSEIKSPEELPEPFSESPITIDVRNKRLFLVSSNLEELDLKSNKWKVLGLRFDAEAIAYSDRDKCIYAVPTPTNSSEHVDVILKFAPDGRFIGEIRLDKPIQHTRMAGAPGQLVCNKGYLMYLGSPVWIDVEKPFHPVAIIDAQNGKVIYQGTVHGDIRRTLSRGP